MIDPWRADEIYMASREYRLAEFAEWLISLDDDDPNSPGRKDRQTVTLTKIINKAKEALDG